VSKVQSRTGIPVSSSHADLYSKAKKYSGTSPYQPLREAKAVIEV